MVLSATVTPSPAVCQQQQQKGDECSAAQAGSNVQGRVRDKAAVGVCVRDLPLLAHVLKKHAFPTGG